MVQVDSCNGALDDLTIMDEIVAAVSQYEVQAPHGREIDHAEQSHDTLELRHSEQAYVARIATSFTTRRATRHDAASWPGSPESIELAPL